MELDNIVEFNDDPSAVIDIPGFKVSAHIIMDIQFGLDKIKILLPLPLLLDNDFAAEHYAFSPGHGFKYILGYFSLLLYSLFSS